MRCCDRAAKALLGVHQQRTLPLDSPASSWALGMAVLVPTHPQRISQVASRDHVLPKALCKLLLAACGRQPARAARAGRTGGGGADSARPTAYRPGDTVTSATPDANSLMMRLRDAAPGSAAAGGAVEAYRRDACRAAERRARKTWRRLEAILLRREQHLAHTRSQRAGACGLCSAID